MSFVRVNRTELACFELLLHVVMFSDNAGGAMFAVSLKEGATTQGLEQSLALDHVFAHEHVCSSTIS